MVVLAVFVAVAISWAGWQQAAKLLWCVVSIAPLLLPVVAGGISAGRQIAAVCGGGTTSSSTSSNDG